MYAWLRWSRHCRYFHDDDDDVHPLSLAPLCSDDDHNYYYYHLYLPLLMLLGPLQDSPSHHHPLKLQQHCAVPTDEDDVVDQQHQMK